MQNNSNAQEACWLPVAAYARMSSDSQNQSVQQQLDGISDYALAHRMTIVRTFVDEGRSGLAFDNRPGLQSLLAAVDEEGCAFRSIIVYDVSRWGRFQDVDESAFYEHLCRRAGVPVVYCAEQFGDDRSPMHAILKGIKRVMAAEYSRELSAKVWHAQCRFARMGYKQGGLPGFGLRRVPISVDGTARAALAPGERKPVLTDRIALKMGSDVDVMLVRRIYALYTIERLGDSAIAAQLRGEGLCNHLGKPWDAATVRRILTSEKYCGTLLFNRTTRRLRSPVAVTPEATWVRCDDALESIVSRQAFEATQRVRNERAAGASREAVLENLQAVFRRYGKINAQLCKDPSLPGRETIHALFGGYVEAYRAANLPLQHTPTGALGIRSTRVIMAQLVAQATELAMLAGAAVDPTNAWNVLLVNGSTRIRVALSSCRRYPDKVHRWRVPVHKGMAADFVVCGLMDGNNERIDRFLLIPTSTTQQGSLFLSEKSLSRGRVQSFASLAAVFGV